MFDNPALLAIFAITARRGKASDSERGGTARHVHPSARSFVWARGAKVGRTASNPGRQRAAAVKPKHLLQQHPASLLSDVILLQDSEEGGRRRDESA